MGSQFLYRSDDRAASWKKISPDLTRTIDINTLPLMGKLWGPDAVAKNTSTALYSNISAISESPKNERLLYVGTDDGLIEVSEDGGTTWRKIENFPGVTSDRPYVSRIRASVNDERHGLRHAGEPPERRLRAVRVQEHRCRAHVDVDRRRPAEAGLGVRVRRGSCRSEPAVRGNGVRRLLHQGWRRSTG